MTDGRYDSRRGRYDPPRSSNERFDRSSREDRGFFDRARDEVSSWFGDDEAERRRDRDDRFEGGRFGREQGHDDHERGPRQMGGSSRQPYTGRYWAGSDSGDDFDRPPASHNPPGQNYDRGSSQRQSASRAAPKQTSGRHDTDYSEWRGRQIEELDRDYDEFRRENQSRFDDEFSTWRGQRQTKRQLLATVTEHMDVVGSDSQPVGKVDHVRRDRIILTKSDSPDGLHHVISCSKIDRVEDGKVFLDHSAEDARREFGEDSRNRALFERDDQGEDGPHMLNRSFSGTY